MNSRPDVRLRIDELGVVLAAHAGGIELVEIIGGAARVRYTGMCTGCPLRPLTTASTVRPALLELDGIKSVEVEGSRISAEAEARLVAAFKKSGGADSHCPEHEGRDDARRLPASEQVERLRAVEKQSLSPVAGYSRQ